MKISKMNCLRAAVVGIFMVLAALALRPEQAKADGLSRQQVVSGDGVVDMKVSYGQTTYTENGQIVRNAFRNVSDGGVVCTFYFGPDGVAYHGTVKSIEGEKAVRFLKKVKIGKKYYAFDENGHMVTGVQVVMKRFDSGKIWFFDKSGAMNKKKSKKLQKAAAKGMDYNAFKKLLKKKFKVKPAGKLKKTGYDCVNIKGCSYGFDVRYKNFVVHGEQNKRKTKRVMFYLRNLAE